MVDASFQQKHMAFVIIAYVIDSCCSFLDWWTGSIGSCQTTIGLPESSRYELLEIVANVTSCWIVTDKEDGVCVKGDLSVQPFKICIC